MNDEMSDDRKFLVKSLQIHDCQSCPFHQFDPDWDVPAYWGRHICYLFSVPKILPNPESYPDFLMMNRMGKKDDGIISIPKWCGLKSFVIVFKDGVFEQIDWSEYEQKEWN